MFIDRNAQGKITSAFSRPQRKGQERVQKDDPELLAFLNPEPTYAEKRRGEYPAIGDQLDVIWKELNYRRIKGDPLTQEADNVLNKILAVKNKYPKPEAQQ